MKKAIIKVYWVLLICCLTFASHAQIQTDSTAIYRVETTDGNEYTGVLISQDTSELILQTEKLGSLTFNRRDVLRFYQIRADKIKEGIYWADNPQSARYLWAPNGYGLKKGEGYYQNIWVLFNQVSVGVTDYLSIGAGLVPLFLFSGSPTPIWITPKLSIPVVKDKFNLGAGALVATVLGEEGTGFGLLYGIATAGSRDRNITFGLGYGYAGGDWADAPVLNISSMIRTGARGYFLTENYYINSAGEGYVLLLSAGYRWVIKKAGLDFGLFMPYESSLSDVFLIPWVGITIPFGNVPGSEKRK